MPDYTGGYTGAVDTASIMQSRAVVDAMRQQAMQQQARQMAAQSAWGPVLQRLMTQGAQPQPIQQPGIPPLPGTPAGGPQPPGPGVSSLAPPPAPPMPQQAPPPMAAPPGPIPPFRAMPTTPQVPPQAPQASGAGALPPGPIGAPPMPAQAPAAAPPAMAAGTNAPDQFGLPRILEALKVSGVPAEQWGAMLDNLPEPVKNNAAQQIKMLHEQNAALTSWANLQVKEGQLRDRERQTDIREEAERRRREQGDAALQIKREKEARLKANAAAAAGGTGNLKSVELLYPRGADGKPDESQPPIGSRGVTKTGRIITLDAEGKPTNQGDLAAGTHKEKASLDKGAGGQGAVRASIVKGGVVNSLNRLNEIEKEFGDNVTTSSFFGQHGDSPVTRGAYGLARGMQGAKQQEADAKWASFIDEAIPVFTGGLRGSDAFRRFLIEQAPAPGDKPATVAEKRRLFRENINGTSKAFFSKFQSDPTMWAPGTKPEDVQGTAGAGAPGAGAAPQYQEGQTATGPGGKKLVFRGGKWQPMQ